MFKIGDKVRILSNIDVLIDDFSGGYVEEMKSDLGKETEIIEIYKENEEFIGYIVKNSEYVWDEKALELINKEKLNKKDLNEDNILKHFFDLQYNAFKVSQSFKFCCCMEETDDK